ncbi:hypothetical protein DUI87_04381 [Hirundo rustica rustica]|uniref:Uncharacterized protein n=1 Tax=Hirundo rustica rustica TaxID=333673 RepID=A0A3M0KYW6_HIRRU|nr:hypothetical protein DUI87_04381 [Hirundo rustica rustica]
MDGDGGGAVQMSGRSGGGRETSPVPGDGAHQEVALKNLSPDRPSKAGNPDSDSEGIVGDLELCRSPRVSIEQGVRTVRFTDGSLLQCLAKLHEIIEDWPHESGLILIFQVIPSPMIHTMIHTVVNNLSTYQ